MACPRVGGEDASLELVESGYSAPSGAPLELAGSGRFASSGPSKQREGSKQQRADEV